MHQIIPLNNLAVHLQHLIKGRLWLKVIIGLVLGLGLGLLINPATGLVPEHISILLGNWLDLPGKVFMRLVQMVMIPLIFTSIISGIASNSSGNLKSFGLKLLLYFIFTTTVAVVIGVILAYIFKPGVYIFNLGGFPGGSNSLIESAEKVNFMENIPDAISNLIPNNPLQSILGGEMLGVVIFTIIVGVAITQLQSNLSQPLIRVAEAVQKICMIIIGWSMNLVPYAVFGLMAALLSRIGVEILLGLGYYMAVVILGLFLILIFYTILVATITRKNPFKFFRLIRAPQLLAFSTASSAAVMPLSMKTADEKLDVSCFRRWDTQIRIRII